MSLVGSSPTQPSLAPAPHRDPGVGGVGALEALLARRRDRADVAGNVARRQAEPAQPRDHDVGEVLAHAVALLERLRQRRRDHGGLGVVAELRADAVHQLLGPFEHRASPREALAGVLGRWLVVRHEAAGMEVVRRRIRIERGRGVGGVADLLPGRGRGGVRRRFAVDLHRGLGRYRQRAVRLLDGHPGDPVPEEALALGGHHRRRHDVDGGGVDDLSRLVARQQPQRAVRVGDVGAVLVERDVLDVVDHASPIAFSAFAAVGPCRK